MRPTYSLKIMMTLCLVLIVGFGANKVFGAEYPSKPIKIIVAFRAGSGTDRDARGIAPYLEKYLGVRINVENIKGAAGKIGTTKVWRAKPDGYTLMVHTHAMTIIGTRIYDVEYKIDQFSHIYFWTTANSTLVCPTTKWNTLQELIAEGKKRPLIAGAPGRGSPSHFNTIRLIDKLGVKARWVPFSGGGETLGALAGGHIDFSIHGEAMVTPLVRAGRIRPLVIMSNTKSKFFPNVPIAKDMGYDVYWMPVARACDGPPNMPPAIKKKLEWAFEQSLKDPEYLAWAKERRVEVHPLNSNQYGELLKEHEAVIDRDIGRYRKMIKK